MAGGLAILAALLVPLAVTILADVLLVGTVLLAIEAWRQRRSARPTPAEVEYYAGRRCAWPLDQELEQRELAAFRRGGAL